MFGGVDICDSFVNTQKVGIGLFHRYLSNLEEK